jgi:hypothetical protein
MPRFESISKTYFKRHFQRAKTILQIKIYKQAPRGLAGIRYGG